MRLQGDIFGDPDFDAFDTEILSMDLTSSVSIFGDPDFDIFGDPDFDAAGDQTSSTFDTEILSMDLSSSMRLQGDIFGDPDFDAFDTEILSMDLTSSMRLQGDIFGDPDFDAFDTEILSMDLTSSVSIFGDPDFGELRLATNETIEIVVGYSENLLSGTDPDSDNEIPTEMSMDWEFRGHVTVLKAREDEPTGEGGGGDFQVDSFFDVFTELSNSDGKKGLNAVNVKVAIAMNDDGNISSNLTLRIRPIDGKNEVGSWRVDSFFDITYRNRRPLDPATVTSEMKFRGHVTVLKASDQGGDTETWDTEILSMDLTASFGGSDFQVDSFFDITYRIENETSSEEYRVKVKFPWIRDGSDDESSSHRIRVVGIFGDPDFDSFFLPEVDDEVIVMFQGGDPDRPIIVGVTYNDDDPAPSDPSEMHVTVEYSISENGIVVVKGNGTVDGDDFQIWQTTMTDDVEGLEEYDFEVRLTELEPGKVPRIEVYTEYLPSGPNRYFSVVESTIKTTETDERSETVVETTIDTFEIAVDPATGEVVETWLFRDIVTVRSTKEVRTSADGKESSVQEIRVEVQKIKNDG